MPKNNKAVLFSDCLDGGDEINCGERLVVDRANVSCQPGEFACRENPFCVENTWLCDGEKVMPE